MRILHTGDWHLGRLFHEVHLTDDQAYVLGELLDSAKDTRPDVIVISGDIYDRAVPPPEAVSLLDDVLSRLVLRMKVPVIMIAGNHDGPDRLGFGSRLMEAQGLHIFGPFTPEIEPVVLADETGDVYFYPVPYAEPARIRERLGDDSIRDHDTAFRAVVGNLRRRHPPKARSVLIGHAFVVGGTESESERPLSVGGAGTVDAACFKGFDYVALGHLHRPQQTGSPAIQYAGSLLKYAFSEVEHAKSVKLVEMGREGDLSIEHIPLKPRHDVRVLEGYLNDIITEAEAVKTRDDYMSVRLLDEGALYDPMGKLREVYPNVLEIRRPFVTGTADHEKARIDHRRMSEADLFASFYEQVTGEGLSEEQRLVFTSVAENLRQQDREVSS